MGCGSSGSGTDDIEPGADAAPITTAAEPTALESPPHETVPPDFAGVHWLYHDVSTWAETATLAVSIDGGTIQLDYSKAKAWPAVGGLNANPWIFVFRNGVWYAATFEWFRHGQTSKPVHVVAGDHIKRAPLGDFAPRSGEVYGFMVSGLARDDKRNVQERTPVVMNRWP